MGIRTSNISSTGFCEKIINGSYCKVIKSGTLLNISYVRSTNSSGNELDYNIITFTNPDNTTCELKLPTSFSTVAVTAVWVTFNLPLNYKSFTFASATDPGVAP